MNTEIKIEELLKNKIIWKKGENRNVFYKSTFNGSLCVLQMNDFPDEPLYTLFWNDEVLDIEDKSDLWEIIYNQD